MPQAFTTSRTPSILALSIAGLMLTACSGPEQTATESVNVQMLSSAPHLVTGGSALVELVYDSQGALPQIHVNNDAFTWPAPADADGLQTARVLIEGLKNGDNEVRVTVGAAQAALTLVNYPITGPVISGEHQQPYLCLSELAPRQAEDGSEQPRRFAIGNGEYLETSQSAGDCSVPTRVDYLYKSVSDEGFQPLQDPTRVPTDVATTETTSGQQLPFIVRLETGSINRAIYQIATLYQHGQTVSAVEPAPDGWNQRLVYTFGGGCEAGYFQGTSTGGVLRESILAKGYAVASSTLNVNAQGGCNDVLSAETAMMVKEHFSKHYGVPVHTIGSGASGGAMQQLLIAGAYPGILDGLLVGMTFSDAVTYFTDAQECSGPWRQYANNPDNGLDEATRTVLGGWPNWYLCDESLGDRPDRISPFDCPAEIPQAMQYHPEQNPDGVRCSIYDGMRNIFGEKSFPSIPTQRQVARSPHDNTGVQYGLEALNAGRITKQQFLDINENFGGWNIDYQLTPERTQGDPDAIRIAYETGRITSGDAGLARVPIIDDRLYLDDQGNFHASVYSFTTRARLQRDNGHADNYVIRRHGSEISLADENLSLMDEWLSNIDREDESTPLLERIVAARPPQLLDDCFAADGERIVEPAQFDTQQLFDNTAGRCNHLYPPHAGLRLVAGGPLSNDIMKCQLKPIEISDYAVTFTDAEMNRLQSIFPEGVCDWSRPGVGQTSTQTWLSFGPSPVNRYQP
ncbi:DUF6351 family protein [Pseudohongiella sp. SYSU M77423]|uniref:DUF6351 family protein n=1 Tax=Pseudohongiella sp. SYSU M77423 TaxID=3042312 RepID=UPI002480BF59|nr:DUF6351 family protein [Pseudohongiella sp. SYSU M77423]MDH7943982.1 DUF6351 family protein [Pseudohongiella sp. SYSU M77423]